jgi:flagellar hook protein FlgE
MIDFSTPLAGLERASESLNQSARRIQSGGLTPEGDTVDLSTEMIALMTARNTFAVHAKVIQAADEMTRAALDVIG